MEIICPRCGKVSKELKYCTSCNKIISFEPKSVYMSKQLVPPKTRKDVSTYYELKDVISRQSKIQQREKIIGAIVIIVILLIPAYFLYKFIAGRIAASYVTEGISYMMAGIGEYGSKNPTGGEPAFDSAIKCFEKAIEIDAGCVEAYYMAGTTYYYKYDCNTYDNNLDSANNSLQKMYEYLNSAIEMKNDYPQAKVYLSLYYYRKRDCVKGLEILKEAENIPYEQWQYTSERKKEEWQSFIKKFKTHLEKGDYVRIFAPVPWRLSGG